MASTLTVQKTTEADGFLIRLIGAINDQADLKVAIGAVSGAVRVICRDVSTINSIGVRNWIVYFGELRKAGVKLKFSECSFSVVQEVNHIRNFVPIGELDSIMLPYMCGKCHKEYGVLSPISTLSPGYEPKSQTCPNCAGLCEFDDTPEDYFEFLSRKA